MNERRTDTMPAPADPIRTLKNTRRTLLQLVANIDEALEAVSKEPASATR